MTPHIDDSLSECAYVNWRTSRFGRCLAVVLVWAQLAATTVAVMPSTIHAQAITPAVVPPPPASAMTTWSNGQNGQPSACSGQDCLNKFRDGQSLGYELLQWGAKNQSDPNRADKINYGATTGAQDPSLANPTGQMSTRDFIPGGASRSDLQTWQDSSKLPNGLMGAALQARRQMNQTGCRQTSFVAKYPATPFVFFGAMSTHQVLIKAQTATKGAVWQSQLTNIWIPSAEAINVKQSVFGSASAAPKVNVRKVPSIPASNVATPVGTVGPADGVSIMVLASPMQVTSDGSVVPTRVYGPGETAANFTLTTAGEPKDGFQVKGVISHLTAGGQWLFADIATVDKRYIPTVDFPGSVCPPDPVSCHVSGVTFCDGTPFAGIARVFDVTANAAPTPTQAFKVLASSAEVDRTAISGVDPELHARTIMPGSQNTIAGNPPVVPKTGSYKPFTFTMSELFQGCVESSGTTIEGSPTRVHTIDLQNCTAQPDSTTPRTCSGQRALGFSDFGSYNLATYNFVTTTKSGSCPSGTTITGDMPPVFTGQWIQQLKDMKWSSCPAATPIYVGPAAPDFQTPVSYLYRDPTVNADAWGPWQSFSNASTVCAATGTPTPAPRDTLPGEILGTPSVSACMPGRSSPDNINSSNSARAYSGHFNFSIRTMGASEVVLTPVDPSPQAAGIFESTQAQFNRLGLEPKAYFPSTLTVSTAGGSARNLTITTFGTAANNWTITGSVDLVSATGVAFQSAIKMISANDIAGCGEYINMLADGVCKIPGTGMMSCTDDRSPTATVSGVTFGTTGPLAGLVPLLKPWGAPVTAQLDGAGNPTGVAGGPAANYVSSPMCFAASGPQLNCQIPTTGARPWTNNFPNTLALRGYVDNCSILPSLSPPDTTTPLLTNNACKFLGPGNCVEGTAGAISGTCYQRDILFDCGVDKAGPPATTTSTTLTQACSGALRCLGTECHQPTPEASNDFSVALNASQLINAVQRHTVCAETGQEPTSVNQPCTPTIFGGAENHCLTPLTSNVSIGNNCCALANKQAGSMDAGKYVTMITLAWRLKDAQIVKEAMGAFGNTTGISSAYTNISDAVSATTQPITNAFGNFLQQFGYNPTTTAAVGSPNAAQGLGDIFDGIKQQIADQLGDLLGPMFEQAVTKEAIAEFGKEGAEAMAKEAGSQAAQEMLGMLSTVFFWYGVAQLIGQLIYSCKESQLTPGLGMARKGGGCHYIGQRASGPLGIDKMTVYCCFATPLARIMQENFRNSPQGSAVNGSAIMSGTSSSFFGQGLFGGWGSAQAPRCGGLSPQQMLEIDWGRVDLAEWITMLKVTGLLPQSDAEAAKRYGLTANMTNTIFPNLGAGGTETSQFGPDTPMNKAKAALAFTDKYVPTMDAVHDSLAQQNTCYDDPLYAAWYNRATPVGAADIIQDLGGTGTYTSCGVGCVDVTLGQSKDDGLTDTCSKIFLQQQTFRINRPDWITSVKIDQANWDDHMQISVNGSPVWNSSRWYSAPPNGKGTCDLLKSWKLNAATPCFASSCSIDPNTVPFIDLTSQFSGVSAGGIVSTQVGAIVGGKGEAFARMRLLYAAPPPPSTNPNDPTFRACLTRTGSTN